MKTIFSPTRVAAEGSFWSTQEANPPTIFLGGTIDMGNSRDWQSEFAARFEHTDYVFYNPRRPDWDSSWEQSIEDDNFRGQVEWELDHIESATFRVYNLLAGSASPITLMEIGISLLNPSLVCCPKDYYRRGNVEIVCRRYNIPMFETEDEMAEALQKAITEQVEYRRDMMAL